MRHFKKWMKRLAGMAGLVLGLTGLPAVSAEQALDAKDVDVQLLARYTGVLERLESELNAAIPDVSDEAKVKAFLATAIEHARPRKQENPEVAPEGEPTGWTPIDPVERYLHFEKAYLDGELDPAFPTLTTWELRMVVSGNEPTWMLGWGREMLRNFHPHHILTEDATRQYMGVVGSDVRYGSVNVKYDRPELQNYQNIPMNGGICGRRAFFGRYILRCFGVPTQKRPCRAHGALMFKTHPRDAKHWVVRLAPGWGGGSGTFYGRDRDFRASASAREDAEAYKQVKRAQMVGILKGEKLRQWGRNVDPGTWYGVSYETQKRIIEGMEIKGGHMPKHPTLAEELGPDHPPTLAQKLLVTPMPPGAKEVKYHDDGTIEIPAAGYGETDKDNRGIEVMRSFVDGGLQLRMAPYARAGASVMRGGSWKGGPDEVSSGRRFRSVRLGNYPNFGMRVAVTPNESDPSAEKTLDLGHGVTMDLVSLQET